MISSQASDGTAYQLCGDCQRASVVLIHGLGLNLHMWDAFIPHLSSKYQVLRYDLYGHGQSSALPHETKSLKRSARQLKDLLDELDIPCCTIAGFSIGGMINRRFAMDYPEHTEALIVLNSPHERSVEQQCLVEQRADNTAQGGAAATLDEAIERWFTEQYLRCAENTVQQVREWVVRTDPVGFMQFRQVLAKGVKELICPQPPIAVPTLVMTCENDQGSTPAMSYAIANEIRGAEVIVVEKLRHLGVMEDADAFLQPMMQFLARGQQSEHKQPDQK